MRLTLRRRFRGHRRRPGPFRILVVCTGNLCRSPYVAARLAQAFPHIEVAAAGTGAVVGAPPEPRVAAALEAEGATWTAVGRRRTPRMARSADLIVTMTGAQRGEVLLLAPDRRDVTFTLKELARAAARADDAARPDGHDWPALVEQARRDAEADPLGAEADLADPYGGPDEVYERMFQDADAALAAILGFFVATPGRR